MSAVYFGNNYGHSYSGKNFNFAKELHKALELNPQDDFYQPRDIVSESYFEHYNDLKQHMSTAPQDDEHSLSAENVFILQKATDLSTRRQETLIQLSLLSAETRQLIDSLDDHRQSSERKSIFIASNQANLESGKSQEDLIDSANRAISKLEDQMDEIPLKCNEDNIGDINKLIKSKTKKLQTLKEELNQASIFKIASSLIWGTQAEKDTNKLETEIEQLKTLRRLINAKVELQIKIASLHQTREELGGIDTEIQHVETQKQEHERRLLNLNESNMQKTHLHAYANLIKEICSTLERKNINSLFCSGIVV
jgi:hypothetical protein